MDGRFNINLGIPKRTAKVKGHGQAPALRDDELAALFDDGFATTRDRALFAICLFTGCRISEACQLRIDDIDWDEGLITFRAATTKTDRTRQVAINGLLVPYLEEYSYPDQGYLFPGRYRGEPLSRKRADALLRLACKRVGLVGVSTHSFRRSFITRLRDLGYSPAQIGQATGHKRVATLMHYFDQV